ncbi:MAG: hypothetical protein NC099_00050 [Corallococcus sp.]|nr:hypothetical protein [Corallococcus sp.]
MKKSVFRIVCCALAVVATFLFYACAPDSSDEIKIFLPDGAPALTVANLFSANQIGGRKVSLTITTGADVQSKTLNGEADVVVCPTNMAATLYNKGVKYKLATANLFGLLYLVGNGEADDLFDLVGKVVYSIGKNNTPEFVFKKILSSNGIEYADGDTAQAGKVVIRYFGAGSEIVPLLKSGLAQYAILGEPAVTKAGVKDLFDLQALWKDATGLEESYPQAGVFVKEELFADGKFMTALLDALNANVTYISEHSGDVASLLTANGSSDFNGTVFTADTLERCNIRCVKASDCKAQMTAYFKAIQSVNVGFQLPDDGFYGL